MNTGYYYIYINRSEIWENSWFNTLELADGGGKILPVLDINEVLEKITCDIKKPVVFHELLWRFYIIYAIE